MKDKTSKYTLSQPINRLEWLLRYWEANQAWDEAGALNHREPVRGIQWKEFRKYLLGVRPTDVFDSKRFGGVDIYGRHTDPHVSMAMAIHSWTRYSRRVYHVEEDLQLMLGATEFGNLEWGDIHFPFNGFAVTLEQPIIIGEQSIDTFIFGRTDTMDGKPIWMLTSISSGIERFTRPFHENALRMLDAAKKRDGRTARQCRREHDRLLSKYGGTDTHEAFSWALLGHELQPNKRVEEVIRECRIRYESESRLREFASLFEKIFRIVLGLPIHLSTLEGSHPSKVRFTPPPRDVLLPDRNTISEEARVCEISSSRRLTPEHRQILRDYQRNHRGELSVHFRCGHWRRPPGKGSDPNAPKIVRVSPTIVRRDRLPDGSAPPGAENIV